MNPTNLVFSFKGNIPYKTGIAYSYCLLSVQKSNQETLGAVTVMLSVGQTNKSKIQVYFQQILTKTGQRPLTSEYIQRV